MPERHSARVPQEMQRAHDVMDAARTEFLLRIKAAGNSNLETILQAVGEIALNAYIKGWEAATEFVASIGK